MLVDTEFDARSIESARMPEGPTRARDARARAIIRTRVRFAKIRQRIRGWLDAAGVGLNRWWAWTDRPPSLRAMWRVSAVEPARIHKSSGTLATAWKWTNRTERPILFVVVVLAPGFLQPLLRWVFQRPTRRLGFWVALLLVANALLIGRLVSI